jgi:hypothetical protein
LIYVDSNPRKGFRTPFAPDPLKRTRGLSTRESITSSKTSLGLPDQTPTRSPSKRLSLAIDRTASGSQAGDEVIILDHSSDEAVGVDSRGQAKSFTADKATLSLDEVIEIESDNSEEALPVARPLPRPSAKRVLNTPSKSSRPAPLQRKTLSQKAQREHLMEYALDLYAELNVSAFEKRLPEGIAANTGDKRVGPRDSASIRCDIVWDNVLRTTAGTATVKK